MRFWVTENTELAASGSDTPGGEDAFVVVRRVLKVYVGELPREYVKLVKDLKFYSRAFATGGTLTQVTEPAQWGRQLFHASFRYETSTHASKFVLEWMP